MKDKIHKEIKKLENSYKNKTFQVGDVVYWNNTNNEIKPYLIEALSEDGDNEVWLDTKDVGHALYPGEDVFLTEVECHKSIVLYSLFYSLIDYENLKS